MSRSRRRRRRWRRRRWRRWRRKRSRRRVEMVQSIYTLARTHTHTHTYTIIRLFKITLKNNTGVFVCVHDVNYCNKIYEMARTFFKNT